MSNHKYPKLVDYLRGTVEGRVGHDFVLAQELTEIVNELKKTQETVSLLNDENESLSEALRVAADYIANTEEVSPKYPDDFYFYGDSTTSYRPNDELIQEMVEDALEAVLDDGEYYAADEGDTIVLKLTDGDITKVIVATGYAELVIGDEAEEELGRPAYVF